LSCLIHQRVREEAASFHVGRLEWFKRLTVGDMDHFIESGGMIQFVMEEKRVRFAIDVGASSQARLKVSSKLLVPRPHSHGSGTGREQLTCHGPVNFSLRHKITYVIMINTLRLCAWPAFAFAEYGVYRVQANADAGPEHAGERHGDPESTAALAFKDQKSAGEVLQALSAKAAHPSSSPSMPGWEAVRCLYPTDI